MHPSFHTYTATDSAFSSPELPGSLSGLASLEQLVLDLLAQSIRASVLGESSVDWYLFY